MNDIKSIIATNLVNLRKENKMTQIELAEKINYSDKAISRWERGDALPDIAVLCEICEIFGVTFEYLIHDGSKDDKKEFSTKAERSNKLIITLLALSIVWVIATVLYVYIKINNNSYFWQLFVWAVPVSAIVAIVFNGIWGKKKVTFYLVSILVWSLLASIYIQFIEINIWPIYLIGAPIQVAIILWANIKRHHN